MQSVDFHTAQIQEKGFCRPLLGRFTRWDLIEFARNRGLSEACEDLARERSKDGHLETKAVVDIRWEMRPSLNVCQVAAQIETFLRGQIEGWLPGAGESLSLRFPDLRQENPGSLEFKRIDRSGNAKLEVIPSLSDLISLEQAEAICWRRETVEGMCEDREISEPLPGLSDCLAQKYQPVLKLYNDENLSYKRFEAGIPYAVKVLNRPEHVQCWNQTIDRVEMAAQEVMHTNYESLQKQILGHLQDRCRVVQEGPEKYSVTVSDCDAPALPLPSQVLPIALAAMLFAGGLTALWLSRSYGSDALKSRVIQLSHASKKEQEEFLVKLDGLLKVGGESARFSSDRDRLIALLDGQVGEWGHLSSEFKALLSSCLKNSSAGYFDTVRSQMSQVGSWFLRRA